MKTAGQTRRAIAAGETTAAAEAAACLQRIEAHDGALNAFTQVLADRAMARAEAVDARLKAGETIDAVGPLAGVPIAVKDNICTDFGRTTCASRMLESYESPFSATAVEKLEAAGAVIVGKTNLDEFAMGSSGEFSAAGATRNPWDTSRVPGGSSSGSAAAVAAGLVPVALGSDTGGSVRQPAALTGTVGFKPTYGTVSRWGLVAFGSSLDQIGPIARSVEDAALVFDVISGRDPRDATCLDRDPARTAGGVGQPLDGFSIAVPTLARSDSIDAHVRLVFGMACRVLEDLGAEFHEVTLPPVEQMLAAYYTVAPAEASSNLARYDGIRYGRRAEIGPGEGLDGLYVRSRSEGFGPEVQRRILLGTHVLRAGYADRYYQRALQLRRLIRSDFDAVFGPMACDAVLTPTTPHPAFALGEKLVETTGDCASMYLEDTLTVAANLAGLPAVSVPAGFVPAGEPGREASLPVGIQLIGPALGETRLLRLAASFERAAGFGGRVAPGFMPDKAGG
ncbi:MAG: Asp-tRNA(Asn)/Glu-tRNA(Gln) amidotransferase subunit GatA [Planctomycetota bacterium]